MSLSLQQLIHQNRAGGLVGRRQEPLQVVFFEDVCWLERTA